MRIITILLQSLATKKRKRLIFILPQRPATVKTAAVAAATTTNNKNNKKHKQTKQKQNRERERERIRNTEILFNKATASFEGE